MPLYGSTIRRQTPQKKVHSNVDLFYFYQGYAKLVQLIPTASREGRRFTAINSHKNKKCSLKSDPERCSYA